MDDLLIVGPDKDSIKEVKNMLHEAFTIKDLGQESYFLGIELIKIEKGLYVHK